MAAALVLKQVSLSVQYTIEIEDAITIHYMELPPEDR